MNIETITLIIRIIMIILLIIGLLKVINLLSVILIQIYFCIKGKKVIQVHKEYCFSINDIFYILPSITILRTGKYFETTFNWLIFEYYEASCLEFENDEK